MLTHAYSEVEISSVAEKLPTAPRILVQLGQLMHNPYVNSQEVEALLRQDLLLVAQIIRMANSAVYAATEQVGSLEQAVALVGFAEVHRLVGAIAATQLAEQRMALYPIDGAKLRLNSLFVAVLMEELARWSGELPHNCYTVGLLRPIGIMAMERLTPPGSAIPPFLASGVTVLDVWEKKYWGISNVELAERILLRWRLPSEAVTAIRHHYYPAGRHNPLVHLLNLAASAAADRFSSIPGEESYWKLSSENFVRAGVGTDIFLLACRKAQRKFDRLKGTIG